MISSSGTAKGINDSGQVVGDTLIGEASHAFLYQNGLMQDLGTLPGGTGSDATAINNNGQIVGWSGVGGGGFHAFLYQNGLMQDLGTSQYDPGKYGYRH